jgi:hypothetical protein
MLAPLIVPAFFAGVPYNHQRGDRERDRSSIFVDYMRHRTAGSALAKHTRSTFCTPGSAWGAD